MTITETMNTYHDLDEEIEAGEAVTTYTMAIVRTTRLITHN